MNFNSLAAYLPAELTQKIFLLGIDDIEELRIVAEKNATVLKRGKLTDTFIHISRQQLEKMVEMMCKGSVYAAQKNLSMGYITLTGGHRVGVCGKTVCENGKVTHMTDVSALCIRFSREIIGAAGKIMNYLECNGILYNTLIISPPGCGKTTVLRDIARELGSKYKVCIADERSEIAASVNAVAQYNVGKYTCVMDNVPKATGIMMMLRTMSPQIIITDETGSPEEEQAIYEIINSGVKIITSAHGYGKNDVLRRKFLGKLIENNVFERIIVLSSRQGPGTIEKIITDGRALQNV